MQARTTARDKSTSPATSPSFAPLGQAVIESFAEGVVIFDLYGRVLYANQRARRVIDALDASAGEQRETGLRDKLLAFGGLARPFEHGGAQSGRALSRSDGQHVPHGVDRA